ncbi:MAG TPA: amidohydrolase [Gallicola sp.]|nr:amidohydrolase [Gallicola sp.]
MKNEKFKELLMDWRRYLHENPETAFEEVNTARFVSEKLKEMGYEVETGVGKTGVVASLTVGDGKEIIGIRADMDAINMEEKTNFSYISKIQGKMHACGHDGHTATLLGAAKLISERKNFNGTVRLIFQPAEEPGKGAQAMIDDGFFERFPIDEIYGLHNMPSIPEGRIHTRSGGIMASEDNFVIKIKGKGSHASSPHLGVDPLVIASQIILVLQTIVSRNIDPLKQAVISCTELHTDGVHNAIPSNVVILGDTRSFATEIQEQIETRMRSVCESICEMNGAGCEFEYTHEFAPTINWEEPVKLAAKAARNIVGDEKVDDNCQPWMASEDFGKFLQHVPGCFLFLGSAKSEKVDENIPLHNSLYDYNDNVLEIGAEFFAELIRLRLPKKD